MIELKYLSKTFQMKDGAVKALQNINLAASTCWSAPPAAAW